jgi:hypothetical protein
MGFAVDRVCHCRLRQPDDLNAGVAVTPASDVAAIRAVFDTTAAGWNRGDLSIRERISLDRW